MGAPQNNQNGKKEITSSSFLHIRVKQSDKANWVREANKNENAKLAPWVVETLNAEINKKERKKMKKWTEKNLYEFNIEASDMGDDQQEIAKWVENHIFKNATVDTIQEMLDNADDYISLACKSMGWVGIPSTGGLEVNIW